jgi:hypothetical protein
MVVISLAQRSGVKPITDIARLQLQIFYGWWLDHDKEKLSHDLP